MLSVVCAQSALWGCGSKEKSPRRIRARQRILVPLSPCGEGVNPDIRSRSPHFDVRAKRAAKTLKDVLFWARSPLKPAVLVSRPVPLVPLPPLPWASVLLQPAVDVDMPP
jgi:hypothetical protein